MSLFGSVVYVYEYICVYLCVLFLLSVDEVLYLLRRGRSSPSPSEYRECLDFVVFGQLIAFVVVFITLYCALYKDIALCVYWSMFHSLCFVLG